MSNPLRIVEIVGDSCAGDWMDTILSGLRNRGHEMAVVLPGEGPLAVRTRDMGIPVQIHPMPKRFRNLREIADYSRNLSSRLSALRADVAHMHLFPGSLWGRVAAWRARVPVRATQWPGPLPLEFPISRRLDYATAWMDTALIGGCEWVKQYYGSRLLTRRKAFCVHYPVDVSRFDPKLDGSPIRDEFGIPRDALVISLIAYMSPPFPARCGRHVPRLSGVGIKGHEILLQSAPLVLKERPDARFLIVGDELTPAEQGSYRETLKRMAKEFGLGDRVIFSGFRRDVANILAATDIPVVPSLSENLGGAVEPLLMEKPVVASRVGGLPDVVKDGETGFLVPARDPVALAAAILRLAAVPVETRREWGRRGRARTLELCGPEQCVAALEAIFQSQLSSNKRQA